jgi:hypothetical protein
MYKRKKLIENNDFMNSDEFSLENIQLATDAPSMTPAFINLSIKRTII